MMTWNISSFWKKTNDDFAPSLSIHSSLDIYALTTTSKDKTSNVKQLKQIKTNKHFNFFNRAPSYASSAMKFKTLQPQTLDEKDFVIEIEKERGEIRRVEYFDGNVQLPYLSPQPCSQQPLLPHPPMVMSTPPAFLPSTAPRSKSIFEVEPNVLPVYIDVKGVVACPIVDNNVQSTPITALEHDVGGNSSVEIEDNSEEADIADCRRNVKDIISTGSECQNECRAEKSMESLNGSEKNVEDCEEDLSTSVIDTGDKPSISQVLPDNPELSAHSIKSFEESEAEFVSISLSMSYVNVDRGSVPNRNQIPELQTDQLAKLDKRSSLGNSPPNNISGKIDGVVAFHDFKIKHNIGSGAYGKVFRAEHRQINTVHAIKLIPKRKCWTLYEREFVLEERRILAKLSEASKMYKDFFLNLDASFHDSVYYYFVTPFVAGGDLMKVWKNCGSRFPVERVRIYAAELLHAIEFLHANRICHRDIKLENVFIDDKGHLVLGDFGLARLFTDKDPEDMLEDEHDDTKDDVSMSQEKSSDRINSAISNVPSLDSEKALEKALEFEGKDLSQSPAGTPGHMAPEILWKKAYSYPVDIWSLGVITFQMLFGELPFWGGDKREVNRNTVHEELVIPDDPNIGDDTRDILNKIMVKAPMLRPGATSLKTHPFFKSIDWDLIAKRKNKLDWHSSKPDARVTVNNKCLPSEIHVEVGEASDDGLYDEDVAAFTYTSSAFKKKLLKKSTGITSYLQAVLNSLKRIILSRQSTEIGRQQGSVNVIVSPVTSVQESPIRSGTTSNKYTQPNPAVYFSTSSRPQPQLSSPDTSTLTSSSGNGLWYKVSTSWLRLSRSSIRSPDTSLSTEHRADSTLCSSPPPKMVGKVPTYSYAESDSSVIWKSLTRWTSNSGSRERWNWSKLTLKLSRVNLQADMQLAN